jgi:hypothetical protein
MATGGTPVLEAALQYAELGYAVFPCVAGAKNPLTNNGLQAATTDAEQIERWWTATPQANIAVATSGLLVVDVDTINGQPNLWLTDDPEKLLELAGGVLSITPRGGRHFIFRQPASAGKLFRNTAGKLAPHVDTRADGGYILVPPSVVDGKDYRFGSGSSLDTSPQSLPDPPAWLVDMLEASGTAPAVRSGEATASNKIASGKRNSTLTSLAGTMRRVGMSETEILAALLRVNLERCTPPLLGKEVETIAWSNARYEPDAMAVAVVEGHFDSPSREAIEQPGKFPDELLKVPGFVGDVMAFNLAQSGKPQPVLSLAAALVLLATLTGRKIADARGTRTNLYCLGVVGSGGGKEQARQTNKRILQLAGLEAMVGPESIGSSSGLINIVEQQPAILLQMDEIGRYLKTLNDAKNAYLYNVPTVLMKLFTSSGSLYIGDALSDVKRIKRIHQPHVCLYGTTVPKSLYDGLSPDSLTDGFLSRMLVFESDEVDPDPQDVEIADPPHEIVEVARWWGDFRAGGNLQAQFPEPLVVPYSDEAKGVMVDLESRARAVRRACGDDSIQTMWTRVTEKARKLALLRACSANRTAPRVDEAAARWAAALSEFLTRKLLAAADEWIAENPYEVKRKRVLRMIRSRAGGVSAGELCRLTRWLPSRERNDIIESLQSTGEVSVQTVETTGRSKTVYIG